mgnify:CR=1 FL=1
MEEAAVIGGFLELYLERDSVDPAVRERHRKFRQGLVGGTIQAVYPFDDPVALSKNAESLRNSDALLCVAVPRRRGPAGLRDLFAIW